MVVKRMEGDLCTAYRPQTFTDVVGQTAIVDSLRQAVLNDNHAQCYLFSGESGCGKTTMARILGMALNCENRTENGDPCCKCDSCKNIAQKNHVDFHEINASSKNSVNDIRKMEEEIRSSPLFGKVKIYVYDEAHRLTTEAQNAMLKDTEDMPSGVYIILCSTEPKKIIPTLRNRCESYSFKLLPKADISNLIQIVGVYENYYPSELVLSAMVDSSEGRPRNALRALQKVLNLYESSGFTDEQRVLDVLENVDEEDKEVIDLCVVITSKNKVDWSFVMSIYKKVKADPETIRIVLAGWFRSMLERAKDPRRAETAAEALDKSLQPLPPIKPENGLVLVLFNVWCIFNGRK